ncbi:MAG: RHS repeat-associated core domain-containing protein, partial [Candidatus Omnitrophota bacterium]
MKYLINKKFTNLLFLFLGITIIFFLNLQEAHASTVSYYIYENPNRSVVSLVNTSGAIINSYSYDAFGSIVNKAEGVSNNFRYVGEYFDSETGIIFLRNRYYDSYVGRFITKDPIPGKITFPQRINPYPYCINNPVKLIDPLGLEAVFGKRPLENWSFMINDPMDDLINAEASHEQVWFRDFHYINGVGLTNNVGFGPDGLFTEDSALNPILNPNSKYKISSSSYDEGLMVQAINKTFIGKYSLLGDNWLLAFFRASPNKNNCQDWGDRVRDNYPGRIERSWLEFSGIGFADTSLSNNLFDLGSNIFATPVWAETNFGGVSLSKTASLMLNIEDIAGAGYDEATGQVILYGR